MLYPTVEDPVLTLLIKAVFGSERKLQESQVISLYRMLRIETIGRGIVALTSMEMQSIAFCRGTSS